MEIFRCGSVNHIIVKCLKPPKDNKKQWKQVHFNKNCNRALQTESENGDNYNNKRVYAYMAQMYGNDEVSSRDFGDTSKLTNYILDSGATCNMTPQVSDFIPGAL